MCSKITWMEQSSFWEHVKQRHESAPCHSDDGEFSIAMSMEDIRARIQDVPPRYTPKEDGDFPGPVERWYGVLEERCFTLTYDYTLETVRVSYENSKGTEDIVRQGIEAWRMASPF